MSKTVKKVKLVTTYFINNEEKKKYQDVGIVLHDLSTDRISIKLEKWFNPAGAINEKGECWLTVYEDKDNNKSEQPLTSDIPF